MQRTAESLIAIAVAQIGYHEKNNANNLDNASEKGYNNYTKYARDLWKAGYYNGNKQGQPWCDTFVDWCFWTLCGKNKAEAEAMECQTGDCGAGCKYSRQYYAAQGRLFNEPKPGDQVFFKNGGDIYHTGIVIAVNGKTFRTVEGNSLDMVAEHSYTVNPYRCDFGRPKYEENGSKGAAVILKEETAKQETTVKPQEKPQETRKPTPTATYTVTLPLVHKGDSGASVKNVQTLLTGHGIYVNGGADGIFGTGTYNAVKKFQQLYDLEDDGEVGGETWKALLTR